VPSALTVKEAPPEVDGARRPPPDEARWVSQKVRAAALWRGALVARCVLCCAVA
jgi:hypothetical protein